MLTSYVTLSEALRSKAKSNGYRKRILNLIIIKFFKMLYGFLGFSPAQGSGEALEMTGGGKNA